MKPMWEQPSLPVRAEHSLAELISDLEVSPAECAGELCSPG